MSSEKRASSSGTKKLPRWLPLESNPELLNSFLDRMGVGESAQFCDVYGLDPELLAMVPAPTLALCLLFPSAKIARARRSSPPAPLVDNPETKGLLYIKQLPEFGNACGTIATIHAVANSPVVNFKEGSALGDFVSAHRGEDAATVGEALACEDRVHEASEQSASSSAAQTVTPDREDKVDNHFICFIPFEGRLLELDGMMPGVLDHGPTTGESFLQDAAKVVKESFMALDPENVNFNLTALCLSG